MTGGTGPRGWRFTRPVWLLGLVSLLTDTATEAVYPLLPILLQGLGASALTLGAIEGSAEAIASVMRIWSGRVSDRLARRQPIILAGYSLSSCVRPLLALASAPWHIWAIRFVDRVGKGVRGAPRDAMLAASAAADQRGRVFGFHRAMDHTGAVIGPLVAFAVLYFWPGSERSLMAWTLVPGALVILLLLQIKDPEPRRSGGRTPDITPPPIERRVPLPRAFVRLMVALGVFALGNSSDMFLLLYLGQSGIAPFWLPLLWAAHHVVKVGASVAGGALADRFGRPKLILFGWTVYAAIYLGFAVAASLPVLIALFLIYAVYHGLTDGAEKALIADVVPADAHGMAYGVYGATQGFGALAASILFGAIWTYVSPPAAFLTGAALAGTAAVLLRNTERL